jgi:hypothetical protein
LQIGLIDAGQRWERVSEVRSAALVAADSLLTVGSGRV